MDKRPPWDPPRRRGAESNALPDFERWFRQHPQSTAHPGRRPRAFDAAPPERYDADFRGGPSRTARRYDADFHPQRRWTDELEPGSRDGESGWRRRWRGLREDERTRRMSTRGRDFFERFKEPIIGLGVAGMALPLAQQAQQAERRAVTEREAAERAALADQQARLSASREASVGERVGERWAESEEERVREQTIEGAVVRYGISPQLAAEIYDAATAEDVEPEIAFGLVNTESTFRSRAVSHVGARGLTQLLPSTANWIMPGTSAEDLWDEGTNLRVGFKYLRYLMEKYNGNEQLALTAYNRGPGTVDRVLDRGGNPDNGYAGKVLGG